MSERIVLKKVPGAEVRSNITTTFEPSKRASYPFAEAWIEDPDATDWRGIADELVKVIQGETDTASWNNIVATGVLSRYDEAVAKAEAQ